MAAANTPVYCDLSRGYFVSGKSDKTTTNAPFGRFFSKNSLRLEVFPLVLDPDGTQRAPFEQVDVSGVSLAAEIWTSDGATKLAEGTVFTEDVTARTLTGALDCNTAAMSTYFGASTEKNVIIEFRFSGAFGSKNVRAEAIILRQWNASGSPTVIADETYPTTPEMEARCVLREMPAGAGFTLTSGDGTRTILCYVDNDGVFQTAPIT